MDALIMAVELLYEASGGVPVRLYDARKVRRERGKLAKPALFVHVPCTRNVPCWHPSGVSVAAHLVRTFVAKGAVKHVTTLIAVSGVAVERHAT